jgi:enoyl-[acyl-carrier protein] reductase II
MVSTECQIHENYKKAILDASDEDITVIARFTGHPVRVINNKFVETVRKLEEKNPFPEEIKSERFAGNKGGANTDLSALLCGICAGGITQVKTCKDVIDEIVAGAQKILENGNTLLD